MADSFEVQLGVYGSRSSAAGQQWDGSSHPWLRDHVGVPAEVFPRSVNSGDGVVMIAPIADRAVVALTTMTISKAAGSAQPGGEARRLLGTWRMASLPAGFLWSSIHQIVEVLRSLDLGTFSSNTATLPRTPKDVGPLRRGLALVFAALDEPDRSRRDQRTILCPRDPAEGWDELLSLAAFRSQLWPRTGGTAKFAVFPAYPTQMDEAFWEDIEAPFDEVYAPAGKEKRPRAFDTVVVNRTGTYIDYLDGHPRSRRGLSFDTLRDELNDQQFLQLFDRLGARPHAAATWTDELRIPLERLDVSELRSDEWDEARAAWKEGREQGLLDRAIRHAIETEVDAYGRLCLLEACRDDGLEKQLAARFLDGALKGVAGTWKQEELVRCLA